MLSKLDLGFQARSRSSFMALKKLDVPTELFMYPGRSHGIPNPRNRLEDQ